MIVHRAVGTPPQNPLSYTEWRKVGHLSEELHSSLIKDIKDYKTGHPTIKNARLLLLGPVGAGKSSFINTVASIDAYVISEPAMTGSDTGSFTELILYRRHGLLQGFSAVKPNTHSLQGYRLVDTMGVEESQGIGFHVSDAIAIIEGHVKPNYRFNPASPVSETDAAYIKTPKPKDQAQCVLFVMDSRNVHEGAISERIQKKINTLQDEIKKIGVKRLLLLTNIDRLCDEVKIDLRNVFWSKKVQAAVGIPEMNVFPVENYHKDLTIDPLKNILILLALRQAMNFSSDYLRFKAQNEGPHSSSDEDEED